MTRRLTIVLALQPFQVATAAPVFSTAMEALVSGGVQRRTIISVHGVWEYIIPTAMQRGSTIVSKVAILSVVSMMGGHYSLHQG